MAAAEAVADRAECHFHAMGGGAHVSVSGPGAHELVALAERRLARLEAMWSRFRPDSEISRLNAAAGSVVVVSPETYALIERAVDGWRATGGRFDPTVLQAMTALGYDRSFEDLGNEQVAGAANPEPAATAPGLPDVMLDPTVQAVRLPHGVTFDPGGIGKGYAADLVAEAILALGATRCLINLGGDLRVASRATAEPTTVVVESPFDADTEVARIHLQDGAVATSSPLTRRWALDGRAVHHLIDPSRGQPLEGDLAAVTVVAAEAWWADVVAKAGLLAGADTAPTVMAAAGVTGLVIDADGRRRDAPGLAGFSRDGSSPSGFSPSGFSPSGFAPSRTSPREAGVQ